MHLLDHGFPKFVVVLREMLLDAAAKEVEVLECIMCHDAPASCIFSPRQHVVVCVSCSVYSVAAPCPVCYQVVNHAEPYSRAGRTAVNGAGIHQVC